MSGDKDLRVTITVRNALLLRAIEASGYASVAAFAKANGLPYQKIINYIALRATPYNRHGDLSDTVMRLSFALKTTPESLFPPRLMRQALQKNSVTRDVTADDFMTIATSETPEMALLKSDAADSLIQAVETLPPRYAQVLKMRYGIGGYEPHTLEECAHSAGVTRERIRQMVLSGERRLRHPSKNLRALCAPLLGDAP